MARFHVNVANLTYVVGAVILLAMAVSAHQDGEHHDDNVQVRQRRQAWLPRIGRRTTLVLPRTGRPEDEVYADSFENTLRQAFREYAVEQGLGDDWENALAPFFKGSKKRADRNPPSVMMRLGKRSADLDGIEALKKYGLRLI